MVFVTTIIKAAATDATHLGDEVLHELTADTARDFTPLALVVEHA
jgi:hypothetical protein